jgi:hypothetical protein
MIDVERENFLCIDILVLVPKPTLKTINEMVGSAHPTVSTPGLFAEKPTAIG